MVPAQLAVDSYEAGQRQSGEYEAQVSQRPIAIHALEHIGATDRGVMMFRNQTRRGIRKQTAIRPDSAATPAWSSRPIATTPLSARRPMAIRPWIAGACAIPDGA